MQCQGCVDFFVQQLYFAEEFVYMWSHEGDHAAESAPKICCIPRHCQNEEFVSFLRTEFEPWHERLGTHLVLHPYVAIDRARSFVCNHPQK